ncbi:MAG: hypothetical protein IPK19_42145 [Chloroflexi bacterium]|nr:hypothetical protein [Chloroflexota bacterium]
MREQKEPWKGDIIALSKTRRSAQLSQDDIRIGSVYAVDKSDISIQRVTDAVDPFEDTLVWTRDEFRRALFCACCSCREDEARLQEAFSGSFVGFLPAIREINRYYKRAKKADLFAIRGDDVVFSLDPSVASTIERFVERELCVDSTDERSAVGTPIPARSDSLRRRVKEMLHR